MKPTIWENIIVYFFHVYKQLSGHDFANMDDSRINELVDVKDVNYVLLPQKLGEWMIQFDPQNGWLKRFNH